jgi:hypothetical protein
VTEGRAPGAHRVARAGREDEGANARLDDLLAFGEPPEPDATSRPDPWIFRAVVHTLVSSVVVIMGFLVANFAPPYVLILVVCGSAVLVRRAVRLAAEPAANRTADVVRPPRRARSADRGGWLAYQDGMRDAVRRWDRRLEWGATGPERYRLSVSVRLAELVEERLRQRHGFTPHQDPHRARQLLGEQTWSLVYAPGEANPTTRDIAGVIARLEAL